MDMLIKYLPSKVVYITSSLFSNIVLWTYSKLKSKPSKGDLQVGLKTLIHQKQKVPPRVVHCYIMTPTASKAFLVQSQPQPRLSSLWSSSPYVLQPTVMGDVIGTESGDCMMSEIEDYIMESKGERECSRTKRNLSGPRENGAMKREFPPPITLLRGAGRMPWVLKRECSDDGRLIMTVITLEDDIVYCEDCGYSIIFEEEEEEDFSDLEFNEESEGWERVDEEEKGEVGFEFEEESMAKEGANVVVMDLPKCLSFTYSGGYVQDSDSLWKSRIQDCDGLMMGRSGSAPLLQPMTPVMRTSFLLLWSLSKIKKDTE